MADSKKYNGSTWEHSLRKLGTATEAIENPLYSDGTAITSYTIKGNTVQAGTPTPSNPVEVNGVGVRTENLYNPNAVDTAKGYVENYRLNSGNPDVAVGNFITEYIAVIPDSTYTISGFMAGRSSSVVWYDSAFAKIGYQLYENKSINTFTVPSNAKYVRFTGDMTKKDITMFNLGSTAKPHEPYGYKIPILTAQGSAVNYLGSVQSTRPIRKLVFTGTENFTKVSGRDYIYTYSLTYLYKAKTTKLICTHLPMVPSLPVNGGFCISSDLSTSYMNFGAAVMDIQPSGNTVEGLKEYLASQYANGTPVTVYYPLQDNLVPTAAVNEPLMKIGTYADSISNAISIPTTDGANSITVDTTVQPSEFTATWTGWHNATVKEWDSSDWQ